MYNGFQSDVAAALTDSLNQTTYCPNTLTNIAGVNGEGVGIGWQHPIPIKEPVAVQIY